MAESVVKFAGETIGKLLIDEAKFLGGLRKQVQQLQLELSRLQSFLRDADAKQIDDEMIKGWVSQSRDLAYEAEDLIEDFAFKIESRKGNILKRSFRILNECTVRHSMGAEIKTLRSKIADLTRSFQEHGLARREGDQGSSSSSSLVQQFRRTYSHVGEDDFIGLEGEAEMLVGHLVNESDTHCKVVSIHGMGGSGKTTLARKIYNHPKVKRYFKDYAWVCVSQQWQTRDLLQGILIKLIPSQREGIQKWRDEELVRKLHQILQDNRYLIVLDDVWSADAWNCMKEAFPIREEGSKILVTTRIKDVAMQIGPNGFHYEPRLLTDLESWELLRKKTRRQIHDQDPENMFKMEEMGKEMVKYCRGLPLAVVVLGGILARKYRVNDWETVQKNIKAYQGEVQKILELSYKELPHKLKYCFLYLSRYPEDSKIHVETLCELWNAEGMITMKDRIGEESIVDTALRHLEELVERSIIQVNVVEAGGTYWHVTRYKYCQVHDLVRDLCLRKAKEENFLLFVQSRNGFDEEVYNSSFSTGQIHRLIVHFSEKDVDGYVQPPKRVTRHLRSLNLLFRVMQLETILKSQLSWSRMLRVLEIRSVYPGLGRYVFPEVVGNLIHLRYLSLSSVNVVFQLPSSIVNLQHLQTIDLRDAAIVMPNVLWKMGQLRHVHLGNLKQVNCFGCVVGDKFRLDGLNKLDILKGFNNISFSTKDLHKLTNLRQLQARIYVGYDDIVETATFMTNSNSLRDVMLNVYFCHNDSLTKENCSAVVTKLFSCQNLTELTMEGRIGNLPKYEAGFASNLISLDLMSSKIEDDPMETLERLPNLQYLLFYSDSFIGTEMQCHRDGFPQLRTLRLIHLSNLERWIIAEGAMPNLSSLTIRCCYKLEKIPDGLTSITTLKELKVTGMPWEFNRRLQSVDGQEGEDFDKIRNVPVVKIW